MTRKWLMVGCCGEDHRSHDGQPPGAVRRKYYNNCIPQAALQNPPVDIRTNKTRKGHCRVKSLQIRTGYIDDPDYTMSHRSSSAQQN